jgi:hypothetical protein
MTFDSWIQHIVRALLDAAVTIGVIGFLGKKWIERALDRQSARFKQGLDIDAKTRELVLRSQIEYKERQLSEFYGPIYAYLKRGQPIYDLWAVGRLDEIDDSISGLFTSANDDIVRIILTKSHLIRGPRIPASFTHFLTHVAVWHAYLKTSHRGIPFSQTEFPEAYFPTEFEPEIASTTESLKRELDELYAKYALADPSDRQATDI